MLEQQSKQDKTSKINKAIANNKKLILNYSYPNSTIKIYQHRKYKTILWLYENDKLIGITSPNEIYKQVRQTYEEIDKRIAEEKKKSELVFKHENPLNQNKPI